MQLIVFAFTGYLRLQIDIVQHAHTAHSCNLIALQAPREALVDLLVRILHAHHVDTIRCVLDGGSDVQDPAYIPVFVE